MQEVMDRQGDEPLMDQLRRERLLDMEERIGSVRRQAFVVLSLGVIASGPWIGFAFVIPLALLLAGFAIAARRLQRSRHPERWAAISWALAPAFIAACTPLSGGADSPALIWFAIPVATLGARFEPRGVRLGIVWTLALLIFVTVGLDTATVLDGPQMPIFAFVAVIAMAILTGAAVQSEREHRREAVIDPLTGLLNRAAFAQRLAELQDQVDRGEDATLGFLVSDIDHFKRINDVHGHPVGDAVLTDVAYAMRSELREYDVVYRLGGEEFVVVLPGADLERTEEIAERLRAAVARASTGGISVTMSFGAAAVSGTDVRFPQVYAEADAALYAAKRGGRNRVALAAA
jgi:diguanylate cyclase (GGDEF)-like protein